MTFLAIVGSAFLLAMLSSVIVYFTVGVAFAPIYELTRGLKSIREGDYNLHFEQQGPPEFQKSFASLNELATKLNQLHVENRELLRRVVSTQDDERNELSRELHDELGPLLFAVRANASAIKDKFPQSETATALDRLTEAAEALQQVHRRILQRLRPMHLKEFGLVESITQLVRNLDQEVVNISHDVKIDPSIDQFDEVTGRTIYRVVQEALTNVMRHAKAKHVDVAIMPTNGGISIKVSDDGIGFDEAPRMGRGLIGMRERVRALGGELNIARLRNTTVLTSFLPTPILTI
jgi:two-component system sensor histidine kinase UhpB